MLIHRNRRHFHLMPTYRPFFNDYLPHSLSKWALHPRLHCAPNFIGKKKIPPHPLHTPPPSPFYFDPRMCFWICWLCIRTSMEPRLQVLAFIIFHRDKTKQQRDGRDVVGWCVCVCVCWGGGGAWWEEMREGRWLSRTSITSPERLCECVRQCGVASLSDCVPCLLKALTFLPTLLLPSLYLSVSLYSLILLPEQRDRSKSLSYLYCQFVKLVLTFS